MTEETLTSDSQPEAGALKAADLIRDEARRAPDKPGVYRMYGEDGTCLYVGKARSIKKRILQYAQGRFVADGVYDADAVSRQVGAAAMLKRLMQRGESLV